MTESNFAMLLSTVFSDAGKNKGIEFHPLTPQGSQSPGKWEISYGLKRGGWSVTMTYWVSSDTRLSEDIYLPSGFPLTQEQSEKLKNDIIAKIEQMLDRIKRE